MTIPSIQALLKKYDISPKKRLGQHFLVAVPTIEKIVNSLEIKKDDTLVEIGSGLGVMTDIVAAKAKHVFAIEKDKALIDIAQKELSGLDNITWLNCDVLDLNLNLNLNLTHLKIIGNLPYNISSPIIFWMLEQRELIERAVVMLQKEVAVRLCAGPGNKDYGILSVLLQARANCRKLFDVSAKSFIPPPDVVSSVVEIVFNKDGSQNDDEDKFKEVVKGAFGKRRKTLRNALIGAENLGAGAKVIDIALADSGINGRRRPETLSVAEFKMLADKLNLQKTNSSWRKAKGR